MTTPAVVIGTGVNELVAAHQLARAGHRVVILEDASAHDALTADTGWVPPRVMRDLALRGVAIERSDPWLAAALPDGGRLDLWRDIGRSMEAIRRLSAHDAGRWPAFCERMQQCARVLGRLYAASPPDPVAGTCRDLATLAGAAWAARRSGGRGLEELLRVLAMPVADLLDEWFECDLLKGALGAGGVLHTCHGPRSGGTAFVFVHHHVGNPVGVFRPARSNMRSLLTARPGLERRSAARVARITVAEGRVAGVVLNTGEEIATALVVSGAAPRHTLLDLVDPGWLDPEFVRAVLHIRARGVTAQVSFTLDRAPDFETLAVAPSLAYLERAYDHAKYGRVSPAPYLELRSDKSSSDGKYSVSGHLQYAPYHLENGEWHAPRDAALARLAQASLAQHAPAVAAAILDTSVLSPLTLETRYGFPEGQPYHAELALDQAFSMRPIHECAQYRTPIGGLYLCGPGMYPGGAIAGAAGYNAAREIARDLKRARRAR